MTEGKSENVTLAFLVEGVSKLSDENQEQKKEYLEWTLVDTFMVNEDIEPIFDPLPEEGESTGKAVDCWHCQAMGRQRRKRWQSLEYLMKVSCSVYYFFKYF